MVHYGLIKNRLGEWQVYTRGNNREAVRLDLLPLEKAGMPLENIKIVKALSKDDHVVIYKIKVTKFSGKVEEYEVHEETFRNAYVEFCSLVHISMCNKRDEIAKIELCDLLSHPLHTWINNLGSDINQTRRQNAKARLLKNNALSPAAFELLCELSNER